jgi:glycosyltransferase involved in cell wall biosynthesis
MPTCNSNKPYFSIVLKSIKEYLPLNKIIVVDCFSIDGTIETVSKIFRDRVLILKTHANLAYARYLGMKFVETDIFAMIDSDTMILPYWYERLHYLLNNYENIGAVEGKIISADKLLEFNLLLNTNVSNIIFYKKNINELNSYFILKKGLWWYVRGETTNVLMRYDVIKDWKPPKYLGAFEDFHLTQHVLRKGYRWVRYDGDIVAIHFESMKNLIDIFLVKPIKKGLWHGSNIYILHRNKEISYSLILLDNIRGIINSILKIFTKRERINYISSLLFTMAMILGILTKDRYVQEYRHR